MAINFTRRHAIRLASGIALTGVIAGSLVGVGPRRIRPAAAVETGGTQVEGEQLSGSWTKVADPNATNGTAVAVTSGPVYATTSPAPGAYLMSVRVRSTGERIVLGANSLGVGTASVLGDWRVVSMPVWIDGPTTWGVMPAGPVGSQPNQVLYVDWIALQPTTAGYTVNATKIIDPSGHQVTPRGVNRDGFQTQVKGGYWISDNDFQAMYLWGATMVRLPLDQAYWLSSNCQYDPTYAQRVDQAVQSITKRGMIALLSLQHAADGQSCGTSYLSAMADDYSPQFWNQVAARYRSNPLVAFDLFNEPHDVTDSIWRDGGMVGSWHAVGMQQLYDTVRGTGATNLVFISGRNSAKGVDVALRRPVEGYGIVYAAHVYNPPGYGPLPDYIDKIPPVAARYPVVITEFGSRVGSGTFNANVIAFAEAHGLGWVAWKWYQQPSDYALLQSFVSYAPSAAGQPVRDALWKARGWTTWGR